jgi:hypothetical protein
MEILEVLLASADACGCFVQILAAIFDVSAGVHGYQVGKKVKERKAAAARGDELPRKPAIWPLLLLVLAGVFFTGLALMVLFRSRQ